MNAHIEWYGEGTRRRDGASPPLRIAAWGSFSLRRDLAVLLGAPPQGPAAVRLAIGVDREDARIALRPGARAAVFRSNSRAARLVCRMKGGARFWRWLGLEPPTRALALPLAGDPAVGGMLVFDARALLAARAADAKVA